MAIHENKNKTNSSPTVKYEDLFQITAILTVLFQMISALLASR